MRNKTLIPLIVSSVILATACGGSGSDAGDPSQADAAPVDAAPVDAAPVAAQTCLEAAPPLLERSFVDRVDDTAGAQLHLVYALPADGTDRGLDINGQIQTEIEVAQRWLKQQTGRCIRVDTFEDALDVTFMRFSRTNEQIRTDPAFVDQTVALELEARGLDDPEKVYVVYYGGSADNGNCGGAAAVGGPAMQYLVRQRDPDGPLTTCRFFRFVSGPRDTFRGTWAGVAIHETFHSLGVAPSCAPDHDDANPLHLDTVSSDLMASSGIGFSTYTLDTSRTQYYDHDNGGCLDLADSAVWTDAEPGADPLPGRPAYSTPRSIPCADELLTPSGNGNVAAPVRFVNATASPLFFYLLDETSTRQTPRLVGPYSELFSDASEEDVFVATNADTGECIGLYEMVSGTNRVLISD